MIRCNRNDGNADAISALLDEAKSQVQRARMAGGGETCSGQMSTADDANAQLLYEMLMRWELQVEVTMGLVVISQDGTVTAAGEARLATGMARLCSETSWIPSGNIQSSE